MWWAGRLLTSHSTSVVTIPSGLTASCSTFMTVTSIEIHLPSFSHSFSISVPSDSTIIDLKQEISRTCIGSPSTAGQRVIYKGRVLDDTEIVSQIWKVCNCSAVYYIYTDPHQTVRHLRNLVYVFSLYTHQLGRLPLLAVGRVL